MVIVVLVISGYWRIGRLQPACKPTSRMSRLTTEASTGRRMKRSVKRAHGCYSILDLARLLQLDGIVDPYRRSGPELELADAYHLIAFLQPFSDRDAALAQLAHLDEPPFRFESRLGGLAGARRAGGDRQAQRALFWAFFGITT